MQYNETEDDLPLHPRGTRDEAYVREIEDTQAPDREVTLNTGVVLGIFFALALLCAVFFGFGYSIGHKSAPQVAAVPEPEVTTAIDPGTSPAAKPSPVTPQPVPGYVPSGNAKPAAVTPKPSAAAVAVESRAASDEAPTKTPVPAHAAAETHLEKSTAPTQASSAPPVSAGTIYVQVAAVSHQEDAEVLTNALRRKGYAVHPRSDAGDQLIHVQVGPFSTRKEADAMRQRLAGDGYNGFIK